MAVTAAQVKELRDMTGISMMECKKALVETDGDVEKAVEVLRKRGLAKAAKNADRATSEGKIKILNDGNKAYVVSLSCETDFVAITPEFDEIITNMAEVLKTNGDVEASKEEIESIRTDAVLKMGENLVVKDLQIVDGAKIEAYVHSNNKLGALVISSDDSVDGEKLRQVAMHVVASNPQYVSPSDIEESIVEKEREIAMEQMKNDPKMENKPEQVLEKILEGKLNKFKDEISLVTQDFALSPDVKVKDFIGGEDKISTFVRLSI